MLKKNLSLFILLFAGFIDYLGIALVYPLFSYLMLNQEVGFLPVDTSDAMRGLYLGVLISLYSIGQFFSGPILGKLSDRIGRKKVLVGSLMTALIGYIVSIFAMEGMNFLLLLISRTIIGCAAGNAAAVQAAIADISTAENKSRNYGLYSMALGIGFTVGPVLGGILADFSYALPFWLGGLLCLLNLLSVMACFQETHLNPSKQTSKPFEALLQLKNVFSMKAIHLLLLTIFIYIFGWSFYFEFIPLYLMETFAFDASSIGYFYAYSTAWYSLSAGFLIPFLTKRLKLEIILFSTLTLLGTYIFSFLLIPHQLYLAAYLPLQACSSALVFPIATSLVSNAVDQDSQGEAMGIFQSVQALAWALAPLASGALLGLHTCMPIFVGGSAVLLAGITFGLGSFYKKKLYRQQYSP